MKNKQLPTSPPPTATDTMNASVPDLRAPPPNARPRSIDRRARAERWMLPGTGRFRSMKTVVSAGGRVGGVRARWGTWAVAAMLGLAGSWTNAQGGEALAPAVESRPAVEADASPAPAAIWWPEAYTDHAASARREIGEVVLLGGPVTRRPRPVDEHAPARLTRSVPPEDPQPFRPDDPVMLGDRIETGPGAHWEALVGHNLRIRLGPESTLDLVRADALPQGGTRYEAHVLRGTFRARVAHNHNVPTVLFVSSEVLQSVAVRGDAILAAGAEADAAMNPDASRRVDACVVLDGTVWVRAATGSEPPSRRTTGETAALPSTPGAHTEPSTGRLDAAVLSAWRAGMSFLPEREAAALPLAPPPGHGLEGL